MDLTSLIATNKEMEIQFPNLEGFIVKFAYLNKDAMRKIGDKAKTVGFNPKTRQPTEELDNDLFTELYVKASILDWKGLKFEYLSKLLPVSDEVPVEGYLEFSHNNAVELIKNSTTFDGWATSVMDDVALFNKRS